MVPQGIPVVGREDNQRAIERAVGIQRRDNLADTLVDEGNVGVVVLLPLPPLILVGLL